MRAVVAAAVELAGAVSVVTGLWILAPWLALVVGGLALMFGAAVVEGRG